VEGQLVGCNNPACLSPPTEFYWPLGEVTLCENGKYAAVVLQDEIIPCKVEANT